MLPQRITSEDYYYAIDETLGELEDSIRDSISSNYSKINSLKNPSKNKDLLDKIGNKLDIDSKRKRNRELSEKLKAIGEIKSSTFKMMFNYHFYEIDSNSKSTIHRLFEGLTKDEQIELITIIYRCIKKENKKAIDKIEEEKQKARKLISKYFPNAKIYKLNSFITLNMGVQNLATAIKDKKNNSTFIDIPPYERNRQTGSLKEKLDLILSSKRLEQTPTYKLIKKNYKALVNANTIYENVTDELVILNNYHNIDGSVFGEVRDYIKSLIQKKKNEAKKAYEYLERMKIKDIEKLYIQAQEDMLKEKEKITKQEHIKNKYYELAKELAFKKVNGANPVEINQLERELNSMELASDISLASIKDKAFKEVYKEKQNEEDKKTAEVKENYVKRLSNNALNEVNKEAKRRNDLNERPSSKFKPDNQDKKEKFRTEKIKVVNEATLDPKYVAFIQLKDEGVIASNATLDTLSALEEAQLENRIAALLSEQYYKSVNKYIEVSGDTQANDIKMKL